KIYVGKVQRIVDFGAFVNILPGKDGLEHISQISDKRIDKVTDALQQGQEVKVLLLDVDNRARIKLSIKDVAAAEASGV
ncbi:S1 RNA-binding domain-containing protein, partial [Burkholderia multivorans]|uniref:S1 RNA-binding domain-containing protein n=1 Tax=Burkholderia multivorans TaxID=87883 RepID=UPI000DB00A1D